MQQEFGAENVFIDVDTLQPGDDFVEAITDTLMRCDVLLAVVGRRWLTATDAQGKRRLEDEGDYHRIELQTALERRIRTIPVLVDRAEMPRMEDLPGPLRPLTRRHAVELRESRWRDDLADLISRVLKK
jgi:hypothetical protein